MTAFGSISDESKKENIEIIDLTEFFDKTEDIKPKAAKKTRY